MSSRSLPPAVLLLANKAEIVTQWLEITLRMHPESSVDYLSRQGDPFKNPLGFRLKEGLSTLLDGVVLPEKKTAAQAALQDIIRIRAVQDAPAGEAVAFVFALKRILRTEFPDAAARFPEEYAALESRIDELALSAFDLYMKCREQIHEAKANEIRRMSFVGRKMQSS